MMQSFFNAAAKTTDAVVAVATGDDPARLQRRREIRKQIAGREMLMGKLQRARDRLASLDNEAEAAATMHSETTGSPQRELQEIEAEILNLTADRQPIPDTLEPRRRQLLNAIDLANTTLSDQVSRIDRLRVEPNSDVRRLASEIAALAHIENKLASEVLASPVLFQQHFVATQSVEWANVRVATAGKKVESFEIGLQTANQQRNAGQVELYTNRLRRWRAELAAAENLATEAGEAASRTHQAMIDE